MRSILLTRALYPDILQSEIDEEDVWATVLISALHKEKRPDGTRGEYADFGVLLAQFIQGQKEQRRDLVAGRRVDDSHLAFLEKVADSYGRVRGSGLFFPYLADIVGNTICADYLDYLRRDAANVGLDILRDDRVVSQFYIGRDGEDSSNLRMALALVDRRGKDRLDTCTGVVELVEQRFRFAEIIYYHKTKVAASAMFAKALALMGVDLPEVRDVRPELSVQRIDSVLLAWEKSEGETSRAAAVDEFIRATGPTCLLDVEVGDESLSVILQQRALEKIRTDVAGSDPDFQAARKRLRGLRLLDRLMRRRLHKVAMVIDAAVFRELSPGSKVETAVEKRLAMFVEKWRRGHSERHEIEQRLSRQFEAAGDDVFLIYVPPRKVQAKGIETFAIDRNGIVTLGEHSAVQAKVEELSRGYRGLWRLVLLVDADRAAQFVKLSRACDEFVRALWPGLSLGRESTVNAIRTAAWFYYVHPNDVEAYIAYARMVQSLAGRAITPEAELPDASDWVPFEDVRVGAALSHNVTRTPSELADRATLLFALRRAGASSEVHEKFQARLQETSLSAMVDAELATPAARLSVAARLGGANPRTRRPDEWVDIRRRALVIHAIAESGGFDRQLTLVS